MIKRQRLRRARRVEELPPMNCPAVDNLPRVAVGRQRHARHTEEVALHMERPAEAAGEERATEKQRAQPERKPARRIHEQEAQQQRQPEDDERLICGARSFAGGSNAASKPVSTASPSGQRTSGVRMPASAASFWLRVGVADVGGRAPPRSRSQQAAISASGYSTIELNSSGASSVLNKPPARRPATSTNKTPSTAPAQAGPPPAARGRQLRR